MDNKPRCHWCLSHPLYIQYHDIEWGVPIHDDHILFEFLILEGMQAGLNWLTVLKKCEHFRKAFDQFNPQKIARYSTKKVEQLLNNADIIRHRKKIESAINNARAFLNIQETVGSFDHYFWQFSDGKVQQNGWKTLKDIPSSTKVSDQLSKDLKQRGFNFVGSTICYAYMQAVGMVNDHLINCFRYKELKK